mmetsp:Transcript_5593/g.12905  ORF Transcript_5593/g.12905 Transcript_5593/m.12905 type:complete len:231 (-) Transcript_5593:1070-1762(-)
MHNLRGRDVQEHDRGGRVHQLRVGDILNDCGRNGIVVLLSLSSKLHLQPWCECRDTVRLRPRVLWCRRWAVPRVPGRVLQGSQRVGCVLRVRDRDLLLVNGGDDSYDLHRVPRQLRHRYGGHLLVPVPVRHWVHRQPRELLRVRAGHVQGHGGERAVRQVRGGNVPQHHRGDGCVRLLHLPRKLQRAQGVYGHNRLHVRPGVHRGRRGALRALRFGYVQEEVGVGDMRHV